MKSRCVASCYLKGHGPVDKGEIIDLEVDEFIDPFVANHFILLENKLPIEEVPSRAAPAKETAAPAKSKRAVNADDLPFMKGK